MTAKTDDTRIIRIFDTTLRDGEQSPGATMTIDEKVQVARQLARLGVDIIEAGFAIASEGDFEAIRRVGGEVEGPVICSLARAREGDIRRAWEAIKDAPRHRIHTFHSTSDIHLKHQYRIGRDEALKRSVEAVALARSLCPDIEFSPMDATRTDVSYLCEVVEAVIKAGAGTVNIPDTVGYTTPEEFGALIRTITERVPNIREAVISVHCHNDLGLAVANSLAAILNGAGQVECTINGIGERAGNCSMEEVVMALWTRREFYRARTGVETTEIMRASRLITKVTGMEVQPNKAIVGANAFAHESGIHQDGLLKEKTTYEIISPEVVGLRHSTKLVLGKHSGRHAFKARLKELGYDLAEDDVERAFADFKRLADQKKEVYDEDLEAIVSSERSAAPEVYAVESLDVQCGTVRKPRAVARLRTPDGTVERAAEGDGPVDATFKALTAIIGDHARLLKFEVKSVTKGMDAQGEVSVTLDRDGTTVRGHGADTDILVASAKAYISAINKLAALTTP